MTRRRTTFGVLVLGPLLMQCSLFGPRGDVRIATASGRERATIAFGFIEDRHDRFTPHATANFADMLSFELMQRNYRVIEADRSVLRPDPVAAAQEAIREQERLLQERRNSESQPNSQTRARTNNSSGMQDETRDLLPERLRYVAGEIAYASRPDDPTERLLRPSEIQKLHETVAFDFFLQGAVGATDTGLLLETEESSLIFLDIYGASGTRVGAISFTVTEESLKEASFLREVAERIADEFSRRNFQR
ncbi:MAG: lipoprotein [Spirochaetales bacterium]|nr:lipoprotein [Leptospiraceae bacterium]MCP5483402.1 lipoprotein [Spirochaetales bacterium]MCP5486763.1 lipoprotein [Spirochaetales bacterium]